VGVGATLAVLRAELAEAQAYSELMRSLLEQTLPFLIELGMTKLKKSVAEERET